MWGFEKIYNCNCRFYNWTVEKENKDVSRNFADLGRKIWYITLQECVYEPEIEGKLLQKAIFMLENPLRGFTIHFVMYFSDRMWEMILQKVDLPTSCFLFLQLNCRFNCRFFLQLDCRFRNPRKKTMVPIIRYLWYSGDSLWQENIFFQKLHFPQN